MAEYIIKNLEEDDEPVVGFLDLKTPREEEVIKDFIDQTQIEYSIQKIDLTNIDPATIDNKTICSILMYIYNTYRYELSKSEIAALKQAMERLRD